MTQIEERTPGQVKGLIIDLDDTLYPQSEFLAGAWTAVADEATGLGLDGTSFISALTEIAALGSDQGRIIDRALEAVEADPGHAHRLVERFQSYRPEALNPYPGVETVLAELAVRIRLALLTDGNPTQQRAKLAATGLAHFFDPVVCTDDEGRQFRKPHASGFHRILRQWGYSPEDVVVVGDRPDKDMAGADAAGLRSIRIRQGEHSAQSDGTAWLSFDSTAAALEIFNQALEAVPT